MNFEELKAMVQSGQDLRALTEWGSYPILYISDGSILCAACAQSDIEKHLAGEHVHQIEDLGCDIYYEGSTCTCDECGEELASAYGDPDTACRDCNQFDHPETPVSEETIGGKQVLLCQSCNEDYSSCPKCGINVHGDDLCPLEDIEEPETWGCAKCAGYRLISSGWIKDE